MADDGTGAIRTIKMSRSENGIWSAGPADDDALADFAAMVGATYMYRVTKDDGSTAYRTDVWSLMQIGRGDIDQSIWRAPLTTMLTQRAPCAKLKRIAGTRDDE